MHLIGGLVGESCPKELFNWTPPQKEIVANYFYQCVSTPPQIQFES